MLGTREALRVHLSYKISLHRDSRLSNSTFCLLVNTSNYRDISLLISYKTVSSIIHSWLCEFWHNRTTADQISFTCHMLHMTLEHNRSVHQLTTDFKKAFETGEKYRTAFSLSLVICMKLVWLTKTYLKKTYSKVCLHKNLPNFLFRMYVIVQALLHCSKTIF